MQALRGPDFCQSSSSSLENVLQSCLLSLETSQAAFFSRKSLPFAESSWTGSSLLQASSRTRLHCAGLSRIATKHSIDSTVALNSCAALPAERLTENAELDICSNHADGFTLPEAMDKFASSNGAIRFSCEGLATRNGPSILASGEEEEEEDKEASMPVHGKEGTIACLQLSVDEKLRAEPMHLLHDLSFSAVENDVQILQQEKLRRKRISERNKNKVPWNKGKKYKKQVMCGKPGAAFNNDMIVPKFLVHFCHKAQDENAQILVREKQRRQRIAIANAGRVPWNKGLQHTEETRRRIRERTTEAMKDPKIREKLRIHGSNLSNETRSRISAGLVLIWQARKKLKQNQENCEREWNEHVANAARIGYDDDDEYQWSSYDTILIALKTAWKSKRGRRNKGMPPRRSMTPAHRIKIANAIRAKWCELSYRSSMEASIQARREKCGNRRVKVQTRSSRVKVQTRSSRKKTRTVKEKKFNHTVFKRSDDEVDLDDDDDDYVLNADTPVPEIFQFRQRALPAYKNPLSSEMVAKLKQIRASRRSSETSQSRVLERARTLMAEARMAAKALEAQAVIDESALQKAQQFLAEAVESFKAAGIGPDFFLETLKDH